MRVKIIKYVPGYQVGMSYSMSDDLGCHLIENGCGEAKTQEDQKAVLAHIESRKNRFKAPMGWMATEEPEIEPEVYEKGPDSKSQIKKRERRKKVKKK